MVALHFLRQQKIAHEMDLDVIVGSHTNLARRMQYFYSPFS
jgi:hypothetical protein